MARRQKAEKAENHERWLVTYADMITLLMVFFIVLYAGSIADKQKFNQLATSLSDAFNPDVMKSVKGSKPIEGGLTPIAMVDAIKKNIEAAGGEGVQGASASNPTATAGGLGGMSVIANSEGVLISMWGNLLFESGKANLRDEAIDSLQTVIGLLKESTMNLRVEGHTDDVPISTPQYPSNWELSTARATSVVRYLIDQGVAPNRLQVAGYASTKQVVPNDSREHRAQNRRVDIQILYPGLGAPPVDTGSRSSKAAATQDAGNAKPAASPAAKSAPKAGGH